MKTFGWICVVIGVLAFWGAALKGNNVTGPVFWLGLGIFLVYRAGQRNKNKRRRGHRLEPSQTRKKENKKNKER